LADGPGARVIAILFRICGTKKPGKGWIVEKLLGGGACAGQCPLRTNEKIAGAL
jgi:hypothetical protein